MQEIFSSEDVQCKLVESDNKHFLNEQMLSDSEFKINSEGEQSESRTDNDLSTTSPEPSEAELLALTTMHAVYQSSRFAV